LLSYPQRHNNHRQRRYFHAIPAALHNLQKLNVEVCTCSFRLYTVAGGFKHLLQLLSLAICCPSPLCEYFPRTDFFSIRKVDVYEWKSFQR
jgi:hypothetical protein